MEKKYQELLREHGEDVLAVTEQGFFSDMTLDSYYKDKNGCGNVESKFCMCLTAVMLLKKMGIFDRNCKITKIRNIGGGYYSDGDNFGLVFEYNSQKYALTSKPLTSDEDIVYIPLDENSEDVVNKINESCYNRYVIDFKTNKNKPDQRKK
jgi:hypothetical protein